MPERTRPFDLILWGATGFTGQLVAEYLTGQYKPSDLNWAIAGRDREKLERLRKQLVEIDGNWSDLPIRTANARRPHSLLPMVDQAKVVCSTVGPYAMYGTPMVKACVERGTDYCDLTGEVPWMRRMIDRFHDRARKRGTRIVHACGFDAVPSDIGTLMVQKKAQEAFGASCHTIRAYVESEGAQVSGGTVSSMARMFEEASRSSRVQRLLNGPFSLVPERTGSGPPSRWSWKPGYDEWISCWTVPFVMELINRAVIHRSNELLGRPGRKTFQYSEFVPVGGGIRGALGASAAALGLTVLERVMMISPLREVLQNYVFPQPGDGPDRSDIENGSFQVTFIGRGCRKKDHRLFHVRGRISGDRDPGYGSTARMLGEAAICLAFDEVDSPVKGGVLTPASGIGFPLVERMREAGFSSDVSLSAK